MWGLKVTKNRVFRPGDLIVDGNSMSAWGPAPGKVLDIASVTGWCLLEKIYLTGRRVIVEMNGIGRYSRHDGKWSSNYGIVDGTLVRPKDGVHKIEVTLESLHQIRVDRFNQNPRWTEEEKELYNEMRSGISDAMRRCEEAYEADPKWEEIEERIEQASSEYADLSNKLGWQSDEVSQAWKRLYSARSSRGNLIYKYRKIYVVPIEKSAREKIREVARARYLPDAPDRSPSVEIYNQPLAQFLKLDKFYQRDEKKL